MDQLIKMYATCPDEFTNELAKELDSLGAKDIDTSYRAVYFSGTTDTLYKVNLHTRLASRVFRILKQVPAGNPQIIFDKTRRIRFGDFFRHDKQVKISVNRRDKNAKIETHLIGSKIREAITDSFKHFHNKEANTAAYNPEVELTAFLDKNKLMISLDTSSKSLHKRGYRVEGHAAPLKETLASYLLQKMGYDGSCDIVDPMSGSGTIAIEAAQIASNKAALIHRKKGEFGFESHNYFDNQAWKKVQDNARGAAHAPAHRIYARDIENDHIKISKEAALSARVEKYIDFKVEDFFKSSKPSESGMLIMNLPYGMRLDSVKVDKDYVKKIGDHLKNSYKGYKCGILIPEDSDWKHLGLKVSKKYTLMNGSIKVKFLIIDIY